MDECHFQQHGTSCRLWVPPEIRDPVLLHAPTRKSVACFGAVNVRSGKFVYQITPWFNAESFEHFLRKLLRHRSRGKRMVIVLDNARYHHARSLKPVLAKYRRVLTLVFLPPYSPKFNTIERLWKLARRLATHNRYFARLDALVKAVSQRFDRWRRPNTVLARLCCLI